MRRLDPWNVLDRRLHHNCVQVISQGPRNKQPEWLLGIASQPPASWVTLVQSLEYVGAWFIPFVVEGEQDMVNTK